MNNKSNYLIVGQTYRLTYPIYDDFDEGIKPEIEIVQVIKKLQFGYLIKNLELDSIYEIKFYILNECKIENYETDL